LWTFFIHIKARKDAAAIMQAFAACAQQFYFVDFPIDGGEAAPLSQLLNIAQTLNVPAQVLSSVDDFMEIVQATDQPIIITGSLFWVGHVKGLSAY
jgi:folylpolyglutamate synthase/dihydropteroate synthase